MIRTGTTPELEILKPDQARTRIHTLRVPRTGPQSGLPRTKEPHRNRCSTLVHIAVLFGLCTKWNSSNVKIQSTYLYNCHQLNHNSMHHDIAKNMHHDTAEYSMLTEFNTGPDRNHRYLKIKNWNHTGTRMFHTGPDRNRLSLNLRTGIAPDLICQNRMITVIKDIDYKQ